MTAKTITSLALLSLLLILPVAVAFGQQLQDGAELQIVSKHYSSGYLPLAGGYVEYEVRLENKGGAAMENQTLNVSLVSDDGRTHSSATYAVPILNSGDGMTLHLGPFRMEGEGSHRLLAEMGGIPLEYSEDSFTAYRQEEINAALIAIPLIAAGAGIIGFSLYRRRRAV